jgi:hypothetical protein
MFKRAKTFHALDHAATVTGLYTCMYIRIWIRPASLKCKLIHCKERRKCKFFPVVIVYFHGKTKVPYCVMLQIYRILFHFRVSLLFVPGTVIVAVDLACLVKTATEPEKKKLIFRSPCCAQISILTKMSQFCLSGIDWPHSNPTPEPYTNSLFRITTLDLDNYVSEANSTGFINGSVNKPLMKFTTWHISSLFQWYDIAATCICLCMSVLH